VIAYHCGLSPIRGGYAGVDIFFVISGYLIGSLVYRDIGQGKFSILQFYSRRAKRILPALFGVLIFSYIAGILLLSPMEMQQFARSALAAITSSSNFFFWKSSGYFAPHADQNPLLMTWSLGVEEQFYLLFPALMLLLRKTPRRGLLVLLAVGEALSLAISIVVTRSHPGAAFFMLPTRAWELGAGVLLAVVEAGYPGGSRTLARLPAHALSVAGLICMIACFVILDANTPFPGYAALLPVAGTVMVIAARDGVANRILSVRPVAFVGLVSYSWYLWHWPLLSFARISSFEEVPTRTLLVIALVAFAISVASWRFIEQPFRNSPATGPRLLTRYATSALAVALPAALLVIAPARGAFRRDLRPLDAEWDSLRSDVCDADYGVAAPNFNLPCVPKGSAPAVALIGDSHAAVLAAELRQVAGQDGYRLVELTKTSCPPLDGVAWNVPGRVLHEKQCVAFNRRVLDYITRDSTIPIVIVASYWSAPFRNEAESVNGSMAGKDDRSPSLTQKRALLRTGLTREIQALQHAGKKIYLFQDPPSFDFDPVNELLTQLIGPRRMVASLLSGNSSTYQSGIATPRADGAVRDTAQLVAAVVGSYPGVHLVDLDESLCSASGCRFAMGDRSLYIDDNHLSPLGARLALADLRFPLVSQSDPAIHRMSFSRDDRFLPPSQQPLSPALPIGQP
jgi:peptidoglycan/LPS O-acetylase OafA/YrhL